MSAFLLPSATVSMVTVGSTTTSVFRAVGNPIPAVAVRRFKCVVELTNKTPNIKGRFAWRPFISELSKPGTWYGAGNYVTNANDPTYTGIIDLSADANLNNAMWVQPGVEVVNTSGAAIEQADVTLIVSGSL